MMLCVLYGFAIDPKTGKQTGMDSRPEYILEVCDALLKRLGVEVIDLFYQHRVDPKVPAADPCHGKLSAPHPPKPADGLCRGRRVPRHHDPSEVAGASRRAACPPKPIFSQATKNRHVCMPDIHPLGRERALGAPLSVLLPHC